MDWILPLLAGILVLSGTGLGIYITYNFRSESKEKQTKIEKLNQEIDKVGKINQSLNEQILGLSENLKQISDETKLISEKTKELTQANKNLTDKNISLTQKTIELTELIQKIQTGGDSYCIFEVFYARNKDGENIIPTLSLRHSGEFVLRSVQITVEDYYRRRVYLSNTSMDKVTSENLTASDIRVNVGTLTPNSIIDLGNYKLLPSQNEILFRIWIHSENGHFLEKLQHIDIKGDRKHAIKITGKDETLIYENINEGFPKNEDGTINWKI
jgi:hypothetical protein